MRVRSQGVWGPRQDFDYVGQASLGALSRGRTWSDLGFNRIPLAAYRGEVGGGEQESSSRGQCNQEF